MIVALDVAGHRPEVVYVTVYVPGVDAEGEITPVLGSNVKPPGALKTPPGVPDIVGAIEFSRLEQ